MREPGAVAKPAPSSGDVTVPSLKRQFYEAMGQVARMPEAERATYHAIATEQRRALGSGGRGPVTIYQDSGR